MAIIASVDEIQSAAAGTNNFAPTGVDSLGKDDFLQLLITKMEYQDPLNPMSDEDFISQLAQFSSLEQMSNISEGIAESNQWDFLQMQSINNVMAAGLIGKDVKASYDSVYYDGTNTPSISFSTNSFASDLTIRIKDAQGFTVATLNDADVPPGDQTYEWDGRDDHGNIVESGHYSLEVTGIDSSGNEFKPTLSLIGKVEAVSYRDGAAYFRINGIEVPFGDVSAIGEEGSFIDIPATTDNDDSSEEEDDGSGNG